MNWYQNFDSPQNIRVNGRTEWWIGLDKDWGSIRGGHAIVVKPDAVTDTAGWWGFYDQGDEGACVGFSSSRMMSLLNRKRYDAAGCITKRNASTNGRVRTTTVRASARAWMYSERKAIAASSGHSRYRES
jgi:hypothetical protein